MKSGSIEYRLYHYLTPAHQSLGAPYHPPKSPYSLLQETTYQDPWRLLVATILLNKTKGRVVVPVFTSLILLYPTTLLQDPSSLSTLTQLLTPLGLHNRRAATIIAMSNKYLIKDGLGVPQRVAWNREVR
ncbi:methyl-CpG-binding domain protein 4-like [Bolinopsis microptera]|uniref:methyl-CpG-binding domain protein 4-like n=1 Tax=Bolinopsis microptera TaxID=2820187 RepID=UPI003079DB70